MIKTINRPHNLVLDNINNEALFDFLDECKHVHLLSYNYIRKEINSGRTLSSIKQAEVEQFIKSKTTYVYVDASWIKYILMLNRTEAVDNVNFGNADLWNKLKYKKYKNETEYQKLLNDYNNSKINDYWMLGSRAEKLKSCNRKTSFEIIDDIVYIKFMINKDNIYHFELKNIKRQQLQELKNIEMLIKDKKAYFNIGISRTNISIQYDNSLCDINKCNDLKNTRFFSLDLNAYDIGCLVSECKNDTIKTLNSRIFTFKDLIDKRDANKNDYEYNCIGKMIVLYAKHFKCKTLIMEDLSIGNSNIKVFNEWNVNDVVKSIQSWCDAFGIKLVMINPAYTSFFGLIKNIETIDSVGAAAELVYRYIKFGENKKETFKYVNDILNTKISFDKLPTLIEMVTKKRKKTYPMLTYKDLYIFLKDTSTYYSARTRFDVNKMSSISLLTDKSLVKTHNYIDIHNICYDL